MVGWDPTPQTGVLIIEVSNLVELTGLNQIADAVNIFEFKFPDCVGVWIFDCSSNHEGFGPNALNVNNMNVGPGGKQALIHPTVIPLNNPPPPPGSPDPHGQVQLMVYPNTNDVPTDLHGKAKGMKAVLEERGIIWDILCSKSRNGKPIGTCAECKKSQAAKDAEACLAAAEAVGQEGKEGTTETLQLALGDNLEQTQNEWCCMTHVLSLQSDFHNEKPLIQQYIEMHGHLCKSLPKFHCELNPIEMVWGYAKYHMFKSSMLTVSVSTNCWFICRLL
jgi:hypothetical protein